MTSFRHRVRGIRTRAPLVVVRSRSQRFACFSHCGNASGVRCGASVRPSSSPAILLLTLRAACRRVRCVHGRGESPDQHEDDDRHGEHVGQEAVYPDYATGHDERRV